VSGVERRTLFGLRIDAVTMDEAVRRCMRAAAEGPMIDVSVVNAAKIVTMRSDKALADAVSGTDLLLADGQSMVWATYSPVLSVTHPRYGRPPGWSGSTACCKSRVGSAPVTSRPMPDSFGMTLAERRRPIQVADRGGQVGVALPQDYGLSPD
jgi:hypothetical protein